MNINGIDFLGIDRVIKRGSGEIIADQDDALIVRDSVSGAYFLACDDTDTGLSLLDRYDAQNWDLLMVSNYALGKAAFDRYCFKEKLECYQFAYYGKKPSLDPGITIRLAEESDLPLVTNEYHLISPEEMKKIIGRKSLLLGYYQSRFIGFVGEHLEGSMGLLYVLPKYRQKGFGIALQAYLIAETLKKGYIPFGQVEKDNRASLALQKKLGMTQSENLIMWMWK